MVTVYTLSYNEELFIQFMIDHYRERFPDCTIVIYDNISTDKTVKIALSNNCQVTPFDTNNQIQDMRYLEIKNNCWKKAPTDWVLVCDMDELLDINETELKKEAHLGTTIIRTETFDMINLESNLNIKAMKHGVKSPLPGKLCLFNKKYIKEINYDPGCHSCEPQGKIIYGKKLYNLYHYNSISPDLTIEKFKVRAARLSPENLAHGWGKHYLMTEDEIRKEYAEEREKAEKVR